MIRPNIFGKALTQTLTNARARKTMLDKAGCEISHESEKQVVAVKRMSHGRIHIRIKRQAVPYAQAPERRYYWLADIHFEIGLLPNRLFDSKEVRDFVERYVKPFTDSLPKNDPISLTIDGTKALELHKKEKRGSKSLPARA